MIRRSFTDRSPLTGPVYCDASFLLDLYAATKLPRTDFLTLNPFVQGRANAAVLFHVWGLTQNIAFFTSILAVEECYHRMVFGVIKDAVRNTRMKDWKTLRDANSAAFAAALNRGRAALRDFQRFLASSNVTLLAFGSNQLTGVLFREPRVAFYARAIMLRCAVDTMDAFHYAIMRRCRFETAASSDSDWIALPYGTVITV